MPSRRGFLRASGTVAAGSALTAFAQRLWWREPAALYGAAPQPAPVSFFQRGWELDSGTYALPAWFDDARVQASTRLSDNWVGKPAFLRAGEGLRSMGARVLMRHIIRRDGSPMSADVVRAMIAEAHANGLKFIGYFWHMTDVPLSRLHPEWVCRDVMGHVIKNPRGSALDITSPYREVVLQRLLAAAELGVDGLNFDNVHMPPQGCWGGDLMRDFQRDSGLEAPKRASESDARFRQFLEYQAWRIEDTFAYWRRSVRAKHPNVIFLISAGTLPTLVNPALTSNLVRIGDSAKNEFRSAVTPATNFNVFRRRGPLAEPTDDVRIALGYSLLRDTASGRPPRIWGAGFTDRRSWTAYVGAVLTYGGVANVNVTEDEILAKAGSGAQVDHFRAMFALGERLAPHLGRTRPVRWAAVHWSELSRNRRGGDHVKAWKDVLWPVTGAFGGLIQAGVPAGIVNDEQLDKGLLADYRVLCLPTPTELTTRQQTAVDRFVRAGGVVIRQQAEWQWHSASTQAKTVASFAQALAPLLASAPVRVTCEHGRVHAVPVRRPASGPLVVALSNDFSWVTIDPPNPDRAQGRRPRPPEPAARGIEVFVPKAPRPARVVDAVSGEDLRVTPQGNGFRVRLESLETFAVVVIG